MKFTAIEAIHLLDHCYLTDEDDCYFYGEYTPREGYSYSETNNLISNLKKSVDRKGRPEWAYKEKAIRKASAIIRKGINRKWLKKATLVPVPPSKLRDDPLYDDRMLRILRGIRTEDDYDIRDMIIQTKPREAMHLMNDGRYTPDQLDAMYVIDEDLALPEPKVIGVFDDMLTNGTHFRAIKSILSDRFPGVPVRGIFIARVVRPNAGAIFAGFLDDL